MSGERRTVAEVSVRCGCKVGACARHEETIWSALTALIRDNPVSTVLPAPSDPPEPT